MDIEKDIDSVVEQHRAADVDALVDGNGDAPWQVEDADYPKPEQDGRQAMLNPAIEMALKLSDIKQFLGFSGLIGFSQSVNGRPYVHVTDAYFDKHIAPGREVIEKDIPNHQSVERIVQFEGADVMCWTKAEYVRVKA